MMPISTKFLNDVNAKKMLHDLQEGNVEFQPKPNTFTPVNFHFLNSYDLHIGFFSHISC